ncbi:MAG: ARMT1-like domain-containing protein [Candidatus Odinarchaeum yellowstonii]|uniref:ARMT1-like domain-containing protein n=1 Tax=Odinarchaeota yellowstonii (strain LCB_4) TaxID=1841599 RepID=A0AAF0D1J5_ODILC|nr:MAG: ARMT1-like domain-containing protein [Candidatus Odinarchaeum yellowstonii]
MKVKPECAVCLIKRAVQEISLATRDESKRIEVVKAIFKMAYEKFNSDSIPAFLGSERYRLIGELTGAGDYYKNLKEQANSRAMKIVGKLRGEINSLHDGYQRFRKAAVAAIAGNAMEFFVLGNDFRIEDIDSILAVAEDELAVDDLPELYQFILDKPKILYLIDNAGEIAFDTLLVEQLNRLGSQVTVAVKNAPIMNDATLEDAAAVNMHLYASQIITTGSSSVGLFIEECSPEFLNYLSKTELIIAKGMGYYETITELKLNKPLAILLRAKCKPIAENLEVGQHKNVAKFFKHGL